MTTPHNAPRTGNYAHTPTPYSAEPYRRGDLTGFLVRSAIPMQAGELGQVVAECRFGLNTEANAAFIVRACNSHAALVAALEAVTSQADAQFKAGDRHATFNRQTIDSLRAALAAARNAQLSPTQHTHAP